MKYQGIYWTILSPMIRSSVKKRFGKDTADKVRRNGKSEYRKLLAEVPDIGDDNPMASSAYFAYVFVAAWFAAEKKLSPEDLADVMKDVLGKMKPLFRMMFNFNKDPKKGNREMRKYEAWYNAGNGEKYPTTWKVNFDDDLHRDGSYYAFSVCPICSYMSSKGYGDVMKPLCELDAVMFSYGHGVLHREHTIASGAETCDYWIVPDGIADPR